MTDYLMNAQEILTLYLVLLAAQTGFSVYLAIQNMRYTSARAGQVPEFFKASIDKETYHKSVEYTLAKARFGVFQTICGALFLTALICSGAFGTLDQFTSTWTSGPYAHGIAFVILLSLIFSLFSAPFGAYSTFVIEERFGFNQQTLTLWLKDLIKSLLLSMFILIPLLAGLFWFMDRAGSYWWIYAFVFVAGFQILLTIVYPIWIAPLFNKFKPIDEGTLKAKLLDLAESAGFCVKGIYVMDGSRRSSHANAYFTGLAGSKRIVLFDTLISALSEAETAAVLAHEIGHEKRGHIVKGLLLSLVFLLAGLWLISLLLNFAPLFSAFGFQSASLHAAVVIFAFASEPVAFFLGPFASSIQRAFEYEADRFAVDLTGSWSDLSTALLTLSKRSLSNLTPHPLYSFFYYSHPTLFERCEAMRKYAEQN